MNLNSAQEPRGFRRPVSKTQSSALRIAEKARLQQIGWICLFLLMTPSAPPLALESAANAQAPRNPAYEFMTEGWGGEALRGYESSPDIQGFFHRIGKVMHEDIKLLPHPDNPSLHDELRHYRYDGMSVSVYLARFANTEKLMLNEVVIASPKWPVKFGLCVGKTRRQVEARLGKSMGADSAREWRYADGPATLIYTFAKDGKIKAIKWRATID